MLLNDVWAGVGAKHLPEYLHHGRRTVPSVGHRVGHRREAVGRRAPHLTEAQQELTTNGSVRS